MAEKVLITAARLRELPMNRKRACSGGVFRHVIRSMQAISSGTSIPEDIALSGSTGVITSPTG